MRLMMACDGCDNWYHLECIRVSEVDVDLINDFICPRCEPTTDRRTTWKPRCARPQCNRAAARLSKYCSDWCGMEMAAQRLERTGLNPQCFWPAVANASKLKAVVIKSDTSIKTEFNSIQHSAPLTPITPTVTPEFRQATAADERAREETRMRAGLDKLAQQRSTVEQAHELVATRLRFFDHALRRSEALKTAHLQVHAPQYLEDGSEALANRTTVKASGKGAAAKARSKSKAAENARAKAMEGAPCAFDVRLAWDDRDWALFVTSEDGLGVLEHGLPEIVPTEGDEDDEPALEDAEGFVCLLTRKRCDRHTGWDRLIEASFAAESNGLVRGQDSNETDLCSKRDWIDSHIRSALSKCASRTSWRQPMLSKRRERSVRPR